MDISIILATYNRNSTLQRTLESFKSLKVGDLSWEVIVVDNADKESTKNLVERYQSDIPIKYYVEKRRGKNNALNFAVTLAKGDLLAFTDDDVIASEDWLREFYEGAKRWPEHSVFGGKILPDWPSEPKFLCGLEDHFVSTAFAIADWNIEEGVYPAGRVWGPSMMIRKKIFNAGRRYNVQVGPQGKSYVMGSETEFTKRLEREGFQAVFLPKAVVHHQIRPEQMKKRWLYKRAFIYGRSHVYYEKLEDAAMFLGVPRYLYGILFNQFIRRILYFLSGDNKRWLSAGIHYWTTSGIIYQLRQNELTGHDPEKIFSTKVFIDEIKESPKVSVIIPTYNRRDLVSTAIDSVLNQTYDNVEVIVVDDGSSDNTKEYLEDKYKDKIKVLSQINQGNSAARNLGLSYATGYYVAFLDDDDLWLEDKLEKEIAYFKKYPHFAFIYSGTYLINSQGDIVGERTVWKEEDATFERLYKNSTIISPSVCLFRKQCVDIVGGFDETLYQSSDYDFTLRLAKKFPFGYLDEKLSKYRVHSDNLSKNLDRRLQSFLIIFSKDEIMAGKSTFHKYLKKAEIYYYIATLSYQNYFYFNAAKYYLHSLVLCPFIGFYYWPKEAQKFRFSFLYRILKIYYLAVESFVRGFLPVSKHSEVKHY